MGIEYSFIFTVLGLSIIGLKIIFLQHHLLGLSLHRLNIAYYLPLVIIIMMMKKIMLKMNLRGLVLFRDVNINRRVYSSSVLDSSSDDNVNNNLRLRSRFEILFEDNDFLALNKPPEMLSVPGRVEMALASRLPRSEEWIGSIVATFNIPSVFNRLSDEARIILEHNLLGRQNVPRNERSFKNYIRTGLFIRNEAVQNELWLAISGVDKALHEVPIERIPPQDLSVATAVSHELGKKVYVVHRCVW